MTDRNELPVSDHNLVEHMLATLLLAEESAQPLDDTPLGRCTGEFLANNWAKARDGLLARTKKIEVEPQASAAPRAFRFLIHAPYKRKNSPNAPVKLDPGPIRGTIHYRRDLFCPSDDGPPVAVALHDRGMVHPNYSRRHGLLCVGDLPAGDPISLEDLLAHVYRIVTYQNLRVTHPADVEAAEYFAADPQAMQGLGARQPLVLNLSFLAGIAQDDCKNIDAEKRREWPARGSGAKRNGSAI